jgi:hypothetical protein
VSGNRLSSLDFCEDLTNLEILRASDNAISDITTRLPDSIAVLNLANNDFANLDFLEHMISPQNLQTLDVSGNHIKQLIHLRFLSVYDHVQTLKVGILPLFRDLQVLEFVKHLCPQLESFDDESCADIEPHFEEELIEILIAGSETRLCAFLSVSQIVWEEPTFLEFPDETAPTGLRELEDRLDAIESRLGPRTPTKRASAQVGTLLSPFPKQTEPPELKSLRQDIGELRMQIGQIAELLYVHDVALRKVWNAKPK